MSDGPLYQLSSDASDVVQVKGRNILLLTT